MADMLRQNPHLRLMGALGFTAIDLAANSRGNLSDGQKRHIRQARNARIARWIGLAALAWVLAWAINASILVLIFASAVIVSVCIAAWQRAADDLDGRVAAVSGRVDITPGLPLFAHRLRVSGETFAVAPDVAAAFVPGRIYRLYHMAASRQVVAAEWVG